MTVVKYESLENNRRHETWKIEFSENIATYAKSELLDYCSKISFLWNTNIHPIDEKTVIYTGYID